MSLTGAAWIVIAVAFVAANLPWLSERFLLFLPPPGGAKRPWMRLLEWLLLYFVTGLVALGMERKITGGIHAQDWEFYVIGLFLFAVFAFPGFVYRHQLRDFLIDSPAQEPPRDREDR